MLLQPKNNLKHCVLDAQKKTLDGPANKPQTSIFPCVRSPCAFRAFRVLDRLVKLDHVNDEPVTENREEHAE